MGSKAPEAPDLGPMAEGSAESARIAQETALEQLAWAREQDTNNRQLLDRVITSQEGIQTDTRENAQEDRARYEQIYQPLEDNLTQEFQSYDSPERMQQERGRAMSDVNQSFDAARRNATQRLESYGVDPSQTRNAALDIGTRTAQAAAQAGASSAATRATEQTGRALRAEALNIGKGYPSNVAGSYGQSLQAGNSMIGNANQTTNTTSNAMQGANGALGTSIQGFGQAGNTMAQGYQGQMAEYNANQATTNAAIGAVGGIAGMFMADGGDVPFESQPGAIDYGEGDGTGIDDQVPINASKGEYIIPADVVRAKGEEFFDKLVERYHTPAAEQQEDEHTANVRSGRALSAVPNKANGGLTGYGGASRVMSSPKAPPMRQPMAPRQQAPMVSAPRATTPNAMFNRSPVQRQPMGAPRMAIPLNPQRAF